MWETLKDKLLDDQFSFLRSRVLMTIQISFGIEESVYWGGTILELSQDFIQYKREI